MHVCAFPSNQSTPEAPRSHPPKGVGFPDPLSGTLKDKLWSIPDERTKEGRKRKKGGHNRFAFCGHCFRVPLSDQACAVLKQRLNSQPKPDKGRYLLAPTMCP